MHVELSQLSCLTPSKCLWLFMCADCECYRQAAKFFHCQPGKQRTCEISIYQSHLTGVGGPARWETCAAPSLQLPLAGQSQRWYMAGMSHRVAESVTAMLLPPTLCPAVLT